MQEHHLRTNVSPFSLIPFGIVLQSDSLPHIVAACCKRTPCQIWTANVDQVDIAPQTDDHTIACCARRGGASQRHQHGRAKASEKLDVHLQ